MNVYQWFPTTVYRDAVPVDAARLQAIASELTALQQPEAGRHGMLASGGSSTYHHDCQVLARPSLADVREQLTEQISDYVEGLECQLGGGRLAIANSWANVYPPGAFVTLHDHGGAMLSGAFYVQASAGGHIMFRNPLLDKCKGAKPLPFAEVQPVDVQAGELLLFPGWLEHQTDPNPGPQDKIVLSFNVVWQPDPSGMLPIEGPPA
ncbi:MAG: hypothetical protein K0V04_36860 [Deltaproteobacteria bacterium]|nr:hypothetical protein [Deltaproteobacteria bacterium]